MRRLRGTPKTSAGAAVARVAAAVVPLSVAALGGCAGGGGVATEALRPPLVEAVEARAGGLPLELTLNGVVRAHNQVTARPEIAARIVEVMVRSGEAVERGQPLVRLDDDELRERLRQAEADVRLAQAAAAESRARVAELEARVRRTRALAAEELVSAQALEIEEAQLAALEASADQAAARVDQAMATADERRSALAKTVVRSPVAGRVGRRQAEVGMRADPGLVLFTVGNLDRVIVEVPFTERMLDQVEAGMPVRIEAGNRSEPAAGGSLHATLSRISPFLAEESFTTVGEIDVDNPDGRLRPGMFVSVTILYGESERATLVPTSAVWENPESGRRAVFVVEDAAGLVVDSLEGDRRPPVATEPRTLVLRPVEVLAQGGGRAGVSGVEEGQWVVTVGQHLLWERARDGRGGDDDPPAGAPVSAEARVRATSWERVLELQGLQREDLLAGFLDKQRRVAAVLGAEIPESEEVVDRILRQGEQGAPEAGRN